MVLCSQRTLYKLKGAGPCALDIDQTFEYNGATENPMSRHEGTSSTFVDVSGASVIQHANSMYDRGSLLMIRNCLRIPLYYYNVPDQATVAVGSFILMPLA